MVAAVKLRPGGPPLCHISSFLVQLMDVGVGPCGERDAILVDLPNNAVISVG